VNDMSNKGIVTIHGKDYMTVARRVELSHEDKALESVTTEVLSHDPVVIKATVVVKGKIFTGISAVDLSTPRLIEKQNPYEVAETSAVGRALGFAGYGLLESVASADEVVRAVAQQALTTGASQHSNPQEGRSVVRKIENPTVQVAQATCQVCGEAATEKRGTTKGGKQYHGIFCTTENKSHTRWLWN
jgi:hypothetical protein